MPKPRTRWLSAAEQRAWRAYLQSARLLEYQLDRQLQEDAEMSQADYEILVRLSEAPGTELRMSELAGQSLFSRSRLSHAVARLEALGWVCRRLCPTDKRGMIASLTDAGLAAIEAAAPGHVAAVRRYVFDGLSADDVAQLERLSGMIRDRLQAPGSGCVEAETGDGGEPS